MINKTEHVLGTRRHPRDRYTTESTKFRRISKHRSHDRRILTLSIYIHNAKRYSKDNWTMHCRRHDIACKFLPTLILSDKGSQFLSEVVAEITQILELQISHASTKHTQTHASIKTALKISMGESRSMWHKYVQIAVMNYNTSHHKTLGCDPSTVFHERIPYNVLDLKLGIKPKWKTTPNTHIAEHFQKQIDKLRATAKDNVMLSYPKYKKCYDRKASAAPLEINDYCYVLYPKADNQSTEFAFQDSIWTGPYIVIKVLSNNN